MKKAILVQLLVVLLIVFVGACKKCTDPTPAVVQPTCVYKTSDEVLTQVRVNAASSIILNKAALAGLTSSTALKYSYKPESLVLERVKTAICNMTSDLDSELKKPVTAAESKFKDVTTATGNVRRLWAGELDVTTQDYIEVQSYFVATTNKAGVQVFLHKGNQLDMLSGFEWQLP